MMLFCPMNNKIFFVHKNFEYFMVEQGLVLEYLGSFESYNWYKPIPKSCWLEQG